MLLEYWKYLCSFCDIHCAFFCTCVILHNKKVSLKKSKNTPSTALQILKYLIQPLFFLPTLNEYMWELWYFCRREALVIGSVTGPKAVDSTLDFYSNDNYTAHFFIYLFSYPAFCRGPSYLCGWINLTKGQSQAGTLG